MMKRRRKKKRRKRNPLRVGNCNKWMLRITLEIKHLGRRRPTRKYLGNRKEILKPIGRVK